MTGNVRKRWGHKLIGRYRVFLDGRDITNDCWRFDTRLGKAWVYLRDSTGDIYLENYGPNARPATALIRGRVRVTRVRRKPVDTGNTAELSSVTGV